MAGGTNALGHAGTGAVPENEAGRQSGASAGNAAMVAGGTSATGDPLDSAGHSGVGGLAGNGATDNPQAGGSTALGGSSGLGGIFVAGGGTEQGGVRGIGGFHSGGTSGSPTAGGPSGPCAEGDIYARTCGDCGRQSRSCVGGVWGDWSSCGEQGECTPGNVETGSCGTNVGACRAGTRTRTCSSSCSYGAWSACGGQYLAPAAEICGSSKDENCDGRIDEGCVCAPVVLGDKRYFPVSGNIVKLVADPTRCLLYGLDASTASQVVVFDTGQKNELLRIDLPSQANDIDVSPNGNWMVVAHDAAKQISVIDLSTRVLSRTITLADDPYRVEVGNNGVAYYASMGFLTAIRRVDLTTGIASETEVSSSAPAYVDIELSPDGNLLYAGESGMSDSHLTRWDVSGSSATMVDKTTWNYGRGFSAPDRFVTLSPNGRHVYYANRQLPSDHLEFVKGSTGQKVFIENESGTFAVGERELLDAETLRPIAPLPQTANAAALANHGTELWYFSATTSRMYCANVAEYLGTAALGQRETPPLALSAYTITRLLRDPKRNRLYALDRSQNSVVVIDSETLAPTLAIAVGSEPSDYAIDLEGNTLWVAHYQTLGLARIPLDSLILDGFVETSNLPYEVEALSGGRLAINEEDQFTSPSILDATTGKVVASNSRFEYEGTLTATADGKTLFVGESGISGGNITRYDVSADALTSVDRSDQADGYGFPYPDRWAVALPDGSGVFYAGYLLDGADLSILRYQVPDRIISVTPDGRLATTSNVVLKVSDGTTLLTLPVTSVAQAVSPDGKTLYLAGAGSIVKVDLSGY